MYMKNAFRMKDSRQMGHCEHVNIYQKRDKIAAMFSALSKIP